MFRVLLCNNRFFGKFPSRYEAGELLRRSGWVPAPTDGVWFYKTINDGGNHVSATIVEVLDTHEDPEFLTVRSLGE
jgi:hypothetical protein